TTCRVKLPATLYFFGPSFLKLVDLNVMAGYFSTSKKSGLLRWVSRFGSRELMVVVSIVASAVERATSLSSKLTHPLIFPNSPRTLLTIMCRTLNWATECAGSISQVEALANEDIAKAVKAAGVKRTRMWFLHSLW